jgi:DNA-binding IclR family transcriptional regulator
MLAVMPISLRFFCARHLNVPSSSNAARCHLDGALFSSCTNAVIAAFPSGGIGEHTLFDVGIAIGGVMAKRFVPQKAPINRSLDRGIAILRAFRPGAELLGNGELSERTGLSPATVSRLTQTLTHAGYLEYDSMQRAYRLGAGVLSLGHAMRTGSSVLRVATPLMSGLARRLRINVGLAVQDSDEMVYLESLRSNVRASQRVIVSGHRVPIELTALGRAFLAAAKDPERSALIARLKSKGRKRWPLIERGIAEAAASIKQKNYCIATWQPEVTALATPIVIEGRPVYVLNVSVTSDESAAIWEERLHQPLLDLAAQIRAAIIDLELP